MRIPFFLPKIKGKYVKELGEMDATNVKIAELDKRVTTLEQDRKELAKLSTLMEIQVEMNREQDIFLREQSVTLVKMNENLTTLNNVTSKLDSRIETLEGSIIEEKMTNLRKEVETERDNSINVPRLLKNVMVTVVTMAIIAGIVWVAKGM